MDRKLALTVLFKGVGNLAASITCIDKASFGAQKRMKALSDEARTQRTELKAVQEQLKSATGNVSGLVDAERRLQGQLDKTTAKLEGQKKAMARQSKADALGGRMRSDGMNQLAVGAGIAAPLIIAAKAGADFQSGMIDIQQNADLSDAATAAMAQNIKVAAAAAKQMPESMRQGLAYLIAAGADKDVALKMLTPIGRAATAYQAEISDIANASYAVFDNLKVPADQTAQALDIMSQAAKAGRIELRDMAQDFPALTAAVSAFGSKGTPAVADLSAALEISRKTTGDSASAANNLLNLLQKADSMDVRKNFAAMGVDSHAMIESAKASGKSPIEAIMEATRKATGGDASKINLLFTDAQAQSAARALMQNFALYKDVRDQAMNAAGTVDRDFERRSKSAATNTVALMGSLSDLAITIGDRVLPQITPLIDGVTAIISGMADWAGAHPGLTTALVMTVAAIAGVNLAIGAGKVLYGSVIGPITMVGNAYNFLKTSSAVGAVISGASTMMAGGWAAVTAASGPFIAGMLSSAAAVWAVAAPILAVIGIAAVLAAAIVGVVWAFTHWEQVKTIVAGVWTSIITTFKSIDWLQLGGNIINGLVNGLLGGIGQVMVAMAKIAMAGVGYFKKVLGIKSPSRVFMQMGGHITDGLSHGIRKGAPSPIGQARALAAGVAMAGNPGMAGAGGAGGGAGAGGMHIGQVTINVQAAPGQSAQDVAQAVAAELSRLDASKAARARSSYRDDHE